MNIDERILQEEDRHYQKIRELEDILRMYESSVRENLLYTDRIVNQAAMNEINPDRIISYEESRQISNPYEKQIKETKESIKQENDLFEKRMAILSQQKEEIEKQNREVMIARERERQQREIELIELQQKINKIENEKLEIEERLATISTETFLESFYSKLVAERYPEEYQRFKQSKEQVRNLPKNTTALLDVKEKFNRLSEELKLYKEVLPIYENFYQKFEEMKREYQQSRSTKNASPVSSQPTLDQQEVISRFDKPRLEGLLINISDTLKQNVSQYIKNHSKMMYVKSIDIKNIYQEGNFIIVNAKDNLGHPIERRFTTEEFSKLFMQNPTELIQNEASQPVQEPQQETTINDSTVNIESIINRVKGQYPNVIMIEANGAFEYEGQYRVNVRNSNGVFTSVIIDKTTYDQLKEYFKHHPQAISTNISKFKPTEKPVQHEQEITSEKDKLINDVISAMINAGEFKDSGIDISKKMSDIEYAKRQLSTKSIDELKWALSVYTPKQISDDEMHIPSEGYYINEYGEIERPSRTM